MSDIDTLEHYFDALLEDDKYSDEHELADDKERYAAYETLRNDFPQITIINNDELDNLLQLIAVEEILDGMVLTESEILNKLTGNSHDTTKTPRKGAFNDLKKAIIARDKKMIEILRHMKAAGTQVEVSKTKEISGKPRYNNMIDKVKKSFSQRIKKL